MQLNAGWRAASRPWCLFLHADSRLPPGYLTALAPILLPRCSPPPVVAAAAAHAVAAQAEPALDGDGGDASLWAPQPLLCGTAERPLEGAPPQRASTSGAADAGGSSRPRTSPWRRRIGGKRCQPGCSCAGHIGRHPPSAPECSHCGRPPPASEPPAAAHPWWPPALPPWRSTSSKPAAWGCFRTIQTEWRDTWRGWLLTGGVALRTRWLGQPYGDQGIFVQRALLERVSEGALVVLSVPNPPPRKAARVMVTEAAALTTGPRPAAHTHRSGQVNGLPDWPLLEDCELVRRVKAATGRGPVIVPLAVETSGRCVRRALTS